MNWAATVKIDSSFGDVGSNPVNHFVKSWIPKIEEMNTRKVFNTHIIIKAKKFGGYDMW